MYTMYLDDLRTPIQKYDVIVRSYEEAKECIQTRGMPLFLSFDHDLGINKDGSMKKSGFDVALWIARGLKNKTLELPRGFSYKVHSSNPMGAKKIKQIIQIVLDNLPASII